MYEVVFRIGGVSHRIRGRFSYEEVFPRIAGISIRGEKSCEKYKMAVYEVENNVTGGV